MSRASTVIVSRHRLALGRDLRLVERDTEQVWLEGPMRLRPGQTVEFVGSWPADIAGAHGRVTHWRVVRITSEGPFYRGCCRVGP